MMQMFKKVKEFIVEPCLEEDEPYAIRSQKLAVIAFAVIASNALTTGVPVAVVAGLFDSSLGSYLTGIAMVQLTVTSSIIPYLYLRFTSKLPQWVPDLQIWSTLPTTVCFALFVHQGSVSIVSTVSILIGILMRVRGWYLLLLYGMCINVIHALNNDYGEELPALRETFYSTQFLTNRLFYLLGSNITPLLFFGLGLHVIMVEFAERADQADAAIAMNLAVADKLRRYDTDGVAVILAANKGKVDEKLLEAFAGIQRNLEEYRPHIPDYVIAASTSTEETDDEGGFLHGSSQQSHIPIHSFATTSRSAGDDAESYDGSSELYPDERMKVASLSKLSSLEASRENNTVRSDNGRKKHKHSKRNSSSVPSSSDHREAQHHTPHNRTDNVIKQRQQFHGRATTVFVRFVNGDGSVEKVHAPDTVNLLSMCVDAASRHAKAQNGALQYMQGCGLMVSFNAASRVATHEANACAFALALKTSVDEMVGTDLVMHATIVTTSVLSFFAGNSGQLMLTVLGGFMPVHTAMHHYLSQTVGKAASCVLLSDSVVPTIDMMYGHRFLGGVSWLNSPQQLQHEQHNCVLQLEQSRSNVVVVGSPTGRRGSCHKTGLGESFSGIVKADAVKDRNLTTSK